jgi:hypothetical protein
MFLNHFKNFYPGVGRDWLIEVAIPVAAWELYADRDELGGKTPARDERAYLSGKFLQTEYGFLFRPGKCICKAMPSSPATNAATSTFISGKPGAFR